MFASFSLSVVLPLLLLVGTALVEARLIPRFSHEASSLSGGAHQLSKRVMRSSKKGLGYNDATLLAGFDGSLSWAYNWALTAGDGQLDDGVEFVPMGWGLDTSSQSLTDALDSTTSAYVLGFNEPDLAEQSNISAPKAAKRWAYRWVPFAGRTGAKLVSPAITNGPYPMGVSWMKRFLKDCRASDSQVDAVAMHWYDSAISTNVAYFKQYFTDAYATFKKPIWITEFAGSGTQAEQVAFLQEVIPWLESQSFIERYAAFGAFKGMFVNNDGTLTAVGQAYRDTV